MAYPAGTSLAVITSGSASNFLGRGLPLEAKITPILKGTTHIWHADTGGLLIPEAETFTADADAGISVSVPHVDQPGWRDSGGNAYTGWAYEVEITIGPTRGKGRKHSWKKIVKPVMGQALVDVDKVPDMSAGEPVVGQVPAVTSVNGQTGAVVIDASGATTVVSPDPDVAGAYLIGE